MNVLVDTCVWSLALRRRGLAADPDPLVARLTELVREGRAVLMGAIRQELLTGIRTSAQFDTLQQRLRAFPDLPLETSDFEEAAACSNLCRASGVQGSAVDFLICAVARRRDLPILTTDRDFERYAPILGLRFHAP